MSPEANGRAGAAPDTEGIDREHPWLGLASYTEETRGYFFGREDEVAELSRRVQRKLLTILFGQSGLGKTSILRAGIVPKLRPEGFCPVYVRLDYSHDTPPPSEQIKQAIFRETEASGAWTKTGVALEGESLWEFLHHRDDVLQDATGRKLIPLLIFDQFEEIFTLAQGDDFGRKRAAQFVEDLADLVENRAPKTLEAAIERDDAAAARFDFARADYRVLIALREDYLAHLEGLKRDMPSITQNRMRLARMNGAQALEAVTRPGGQLVNREVAESIVRFTAGGSELANAEVEPSLLSLVCRELNNARITQERDEISADLLAGSRDTILSEFYERALSGEPPGVRQVIEDHLLTESGYRESLAEERLVRLLGAAGAHEDTLAKLVDRRLLRVEERLDLRRVELTHDVLTGVVKASRDVRLEREAREEAERRLDEQRARERATRAALVRARKIATACAVLAVVAVASAVFGWFSMKRAQEAEARADQVRVFAETARGEAEKLVVYLLDDFHLELAPVGRLDIVASLAKRAIDYYDGLPGALRTPQSERNRALALVRYGAALRTQARLEEGNKAIDEAVSVLSRLRAAGDGSEATAIGLALGLSTQARLKSSVEMDADALATSTRAVEILKSPADAPGASVSLRRAYAEVQMLNGFLEMRNRRYAISIASLEASRAAARSIEAQQPDDLAASAIYAEATSWLVQTLIDAERGEEAQRAGKEGLAVAARILDKRPGHMQALRAQALTTLTLAILLLNDMRLPETLAMADVTVRTWREFVRMDPGNAISWSNLEVAYMVRGEALVAMGRLGDAAANAREAIALDREAPPNGMLRVGLSIHSGRLAVVESDRGRLKEAEDAISQIARLRATFVASIPVGTFRRDASPFFHDFWRAQMAHRAGEFARAVEAAGRYTSKLERLETRNTPDRLEKARWLVRTYQPMLRSAWALGDHATGARVASRLLEIHQATPPEAMDERREEADTWALAALPFARAGREDEARALAARALAFQRNLAKLGRDDYVQREAHALALYAFAIAGGGDARSQLAEARALLDRGPEEWKRARSIAHLRRLVDEERLRRR